MIKAKPNTSWRRAIALLAISLILGFMLLIINACSLEWSEAIQRGKVSQLAFRDTVNIDINNGLIFLPVSIQGKSYRFLFDTGAPFSISEKLQREFKFKSISKGNIRDSDNNRIQVNWVHVDSLKISDISFLDQLAFVGDFEANPILKCLNIDGIIGSNLMRHCNWTIDQERNAISLYRGIEEHNLEKYLSIPFTSDSQYNIFTDLNIGQATIKNLLIDYGSNGSISLSKEIFKTLKDSKIVGETMIENGMKQSGIVGKSVELNREFTYLDSVNIDGIYFKKVMLRTGRKVSIGNRFLSNFKLIIDWNTNKLHLFETQKDPDTVRIAGFKLGYSVKQSVYVQTVTVGSQAYLEGVRPDMKIVKLDRLHFDMDHDFCDYLNHEYGDSISLEVIDSSGDKRKFVFNQTTFKSY